MEAVVCSVDADPGRPACWRAGTCATWLPIPAPRLPRVNLVAPRRLPKAADGMEIQPALPAGKHPGGSRPHHFLHGGSRRQMLLGWHGMEYYHNTYAFNQYLASRGYIVLSVNYRSGIGYGMEFREALQYGAVGASEFNDVLAGQYLGAGPT
jgi:dipeptidyl aminopeptidase/acylaminoacyl peptidase